MLILDFNITFLYNDIPKVGISYTHFGYIIYLRTCYYIENND